MAFNLDVQFIQNGIQRKGQQYESFVEFFEQYPGYQQFYNVEQIQIVADSYLFHNGMVNQQGFLADLNKALNSGNLQRRPGFEGI